MGNSLFGEFLRYIRSLIPHVYKINWGEQGNKGEKGKESMDHDMMMSMKMIQTDRAPAAVGPYSQAVVVDGWVYCSGQIGLDGGGVLREGVEGQMVQIMKNLEAVLGAAGCGLDRVVKTTIFLTDVDDFGLVNELYAEAMGDHRPARSTVVVKELPKGAAVEVEMVGRLE